MASFSFNIDQFRKQAETIEANFYASTPDEKLTYTGTDSLVWDKINSERQRRNLPGLAAIGSPRPPEDTTTPAASGGGRDQDGNAKQFTVDGPATLTREQAQAIFEKQVNTGGLVGFKPGDVLSSLTQAAGGLKSAPAIAVTNNPLSTIAPTSNIPTGISGITSSVVKIPVTNGINPADFVKAIPAVASIGKLTPDQVTGSLAQLGKLVNQPSHVMSNTSSVGNFGMDATQLETAGYVKPGTAAKYLASGQNALTNVLASPSVWTGKNGINQVENLLNNPSAQSGIQQGLMAKGVTQLNGLGLPVDKLPSQLLSGVALNSSQDVTGTLNWAQGKIAQLPQGTATQYTQTAKDSAFAVNLVNEKISQASLNQQPVSNPTNTVDRATLTAAVSRVVGNEKIPKLNFGGISFDSVAELAFKNLSQQAATAETKTNNIFNESITVENAEIRQAKLNALTADITRIQTEFGNLKMISSAPAFVTKVDQAIANATLLLELIATDIANIQRYLA